VWDCRSYRKKSKKIGEEGDIGGHNDKEKQNYYGKLRKIFLVYKITPMSGLVGHIWKNTK
jgi:hypothetical protein